MDIPKTGSTLRGTGNIPLHDDGTGLWAEGLKHNVLNLDVADIAGLTNLPDGLGVVDILELGTTNHDESPDLADNLDVLGDLDGVGDDICTVVEVDNLARGNAVEDGLNSSSVIRASITLGTTRLDRHKAASGDILVLGLAASEDLATSGQRSRLGDGGTGALNSFSVVVGVGAALGPRGDVGVASEEGGAAASVLDGNGGVRGHVHVIQNQSTIGACLVEVVVGEHADLCVGELRVGKQNGTDLLNAVTINAAHVDTNVGIVDGDAVETPQPVPVHVDGSLAAIEDEVTASKLLVANPHAQSTTGEGEVAQPAARTILSPKTLLLVVCACVSAHDELDILDRSGLSNTPTNTSAGIDGLSSQVNLEVANLAEEVVGGAIPAGVGVDDGDTSKVAGGLEGRQVGGITDQVGVVVELNGRRDDVGTRREVDNSRSGGLGIATRTTSVSRTQRSIDGRGIVSDTVTLGTKALNIAVDLVASAGV